MSRIGTLAFRSDLTTFVIAAAFYRAKTLLADGSSVQIGDAEEAVLALTRRFDGFKWTPEPLPPREQWVDKDEYEYEINSQ